MSDGMADEGILVEMLCEIVVKHLDFSAMRPNISFNLIVKINKKRPYS